MRLIASIAEAGSDRHQRGGAGPVNPIRGEVSATHRHRKITDFECAGIDALVKRPPDWHHCGPDYPVSIDIATILLALAGVFLIAFMKGAFGGGAFNFEMLLSGGAAAAPGSAFIAGKTDVTYVTIFQRWLAGKKAHEGIPLDLLPRVINQKISPGGTDSSVPSTNDGTFPVPFPSLPWQDRQFFA